ncbi:hypothetical protein [Psychrobacillus vulpis]|uniref:Uncharacterized protein n=1 Tax=Psychrobacillus vulpis TaxID=2325572 RepID=A0A544TF83_9BACI|nr:hypothetical protein [Psychrobacillus vulpis]TQR16117.1 hypothetical protein FG384_19140 [Psychrobacillus vulpis]
MKEIKKVILWVGIIAIVIAALSFIDPVDNEDVSPNDLDVVKDLEKENDYLKQDIEWLEDSLFESRKFIIDSNLAKDYFPDPETEILYKGIEETKYVILYRDEMGNNLNVTSKEPRFEIILGVPTLAPVDGITMAYTGLGERNVDNGIENHFFGGVITNNEIKDVHVSFNGEVYKANIFKVDNNMYGWYSIFKKSSTLEENTVITQALDEDGLIIWERSLR